MRITTVRDLMVPLEEYATVSEEATLFEAVMALEQAQDRLDRDRYKYLHRAILVYDKDEQIVGKISQLDVLKCLEPKYAKIVDSGMLSGEDLSPRSIKTILEHYSLYKYSVNEVCKKAAKLKVKDIMYTPTEGEYVEEDASLAEAIQRMLMGQHQSLLVSKGEKIVGILRLTDVFKEISERIKACES
jgi:CBS domain-containing protein